MLFRSLCRPKSDSVLEPLEQIRPKLLNRKAIPAQAKLDSKVGKRFTHQNGPILRAKTGFSDLQFAYTRVCCVSKNVKIYCLDLVIARM